MTNNTEIENQQLEELNEARNLDSQDLDSQNKKNAVPSVLSFWDKVSEHRLILAAAAFFDILGLIPAVAVFFNFIFGGILFLYFGPKKKSGESELIKIVLPIGLGSIIDFFIGILPVNIGAALIRIALS